HPTLSHQGERGRWGLSHQGERGRWGLSHQGKRGTCCKRPGGTAWIRAGDGKAGLASQGDDRVGDAVAGLRAWDDLRDVGPQWAGAGGQAGWVWRSETGVAP